MLISFRLPIKIKKKGKLFISSCPILDVYSQGETENQARKNIREALTAFIIGCLELGTLDKVLNDCGITPDSRLKKATLKKDYVNIPIQLFSGKEALKQCRV